MNDVDGLPPPTAVFLDFGGVLADVHRREQGFHETAGAIAHLLARSGLAADAAAIEVDVRAGAGAYSRWKRDQASVAAPRELQPAEFWRRFVTAGWGRRAQAVVRAHAAPLCELYEASTLSRPVKEGSLDLLEALDHDGIPVALICNTMSGCGTRRLMREYGFDDLIAVAVYSDELGVRKPNPAVFSLPLASFGCDAAQVWYVGDTYDRDVLAARRAGIGTAILMRSELTGRPQSDAAEPDAVVDNHDGLLALLRTATG